ncbi:Adenylate cyclase [Rubellimicrobium mesophilum DSM 19309]|uniref:Adenylate cyclase n=1 Tax=Rubellimicrobium mesophilum DSM 19309 TaxID=442562 RepID=A0A017HQG3_9RHOB|nr:winged helix-turn-helix domain-containing protein [Rubellimicrobium mesophilum]EYD76530.1 Adenylate cyclase [Rubellimicrobium mesophilum DSM 19309]
MDRSAVARFGPFTFDRTRMVLEREGQPVPIGGRGAALLVALVDAQGHVVTRSELLDAVWPDQVVEEHNLTVQIANLRQAMGALPNGEDPVRTVSRVGYRLVLDGLSARRGTILALRPTVAVLPFVNLSGDPELGFFADGVTEDVIAALSRFRTFAVVARGASFAYKGRAGPAPEVAQALGVRHVLEGSVRREGRRLRVGARLTDTEGHVRWADCFEEELDGVFEMQDRITAAVVGLVEPQITRAELERSGRKHPESMDAYDHFLLGLALSKRLSTNAALYDRMVGHLDRAVALDPSFPQAFVQASWAHQLRRMFGDATPAGTDDFALAEDLRIRALESGPDDAMVLAWSGLGAHNFQDDGEGALALIERAVELNPLSYDVLHMAATVLRQRGRPADSIRLLEGCLRLSPDAPQNAMIVESIGLCHLYEGRYAEAVDWIRRAQAAGASYDHLLINLTMAEALSGANGRGPGDAGAAAAGPAGRHHPRAHGAVAARGAPRWRWAPLARGAPSSRDAGGLSPGAALTVLTFFEVTPQARLSASL